MSLSRWIQTGAKLGASDLHLEGGSPLVARIRGELSVVGEPVAAAYLAQVCKELLGAAAWAEFTARGSADVSVVAAGTRCRVNVYRTIRGAALAIRVLAPSVKDLRACNLNAELRRLIEPTSGLVVLCGPTGCGKSTTLAALIEEINAARPRHIITLESPLEYLYTNRRAFIRQREIPTHSPSFEQAIIDALRENPDVLVVSEMRSPEVIRLTLNAAETGHLVLATMHSATCAESADPDLHVLPRRDPGQHPRAAGRLPRRRGLPAAGITWRRATCACRAARCCGQFRCQGRDSGGPVQPDCQRHAGRRRRRHVDLRPLSALDGTAAGLGAPPPPGAVADEVTAPPPAPSPQPARRPLRASGAIEISIDEEVGPDRTGQAHRAAHALLGIAARTPLRRAQSPKR